MDCKFCRSKMKEYRETRTSDDGGVYTYVEHTCPTCKAKAETTDGIYRWTPGTP